MAASNTHQARREQSSAEDIKAAIKWVPTNPDAYPCPQIEGLNACRPDDLPEIRSLDLSRIRFDAVELIMDKLFMPVHGAKELKRLTDAELFDELKSIKSWIQYFPNTVMGPPVVMGKHAVQCIRGPYLTYCTHKRESRPNLTGLPHSLCLHIKRHLLASWWLEETSAGRSEPIDLKLLYAVERTPPPIYPKPAGQDHRSSANATESEQSPSSTQHSKPIPRDPRRRVDLRSAIGQAHDAAPSNEQAAASPASPIRSETHRKSRPSSAKKIEASPTSKSGPARTTEQLPSRPSSRLRVISESSSPSSPLTTDAEVLSISPNSTAEKPRPVTDSTHNPTSAQEREVVSQSVQTEPLGGAAQKDERNGSSEPRASTSRDNPSDNHASQPEGTGHAKLKNGDSSQQRKRKRSESMSKPEQGSSDAATFATQLLYSFTNIEDPNARKRAKELAQSWMGTDRHRTPSDRSSISMVDLLLGCIDQEGAEVRQFARQLYDSHHQQMSEG